MPVVKHRQTLSECGDRAPPSCRPGNRIAPRRWLDTALQRLCALNLVCDCISRHKLNTMAPVLNFLSDRLCGVPVAGICFAGHSASNFGSGARQRKAEPGPGSGSGNGRRQPAFSILRHRWETVMANRNHATLLAELEAAYALYSPRSRAINDTAKKYLIDGGSHQLRLTQALPVRASSPPAADTSRMRTVIRSWISGRATWGTCSGTTPRP